MGWLKKLFTPAVAQPGATDDPLSPSYIPKPKPKVAGAMHPLVAAKANRPLAKAFGVGIVYDRDGRPKITKDWLDNLPAGERAAVDKNLAEHGWRVTPDNIIQRT